MKKLFTLITFIGLALGANAQRHIDFQVTLTSPAASSTIDTSTVFDINMVFTNKGPIVFAATDTFWYKVTLGGGAIAFSSAADTVRGRTNRVMNVGDTIQVNYTGIKFSHYPYTSTSTHSFCGVFVGTQNLTSPIVDTNSADDQSCNTVTIIGLSVPTVSLSNGTLSMYPNPVKSNANFDLELNQSANVTIRIFDMFGRSIITEDKGQLNMGKHILSVNTDALQNGMYLYQVIIGAETSAGRFTISK